MITSHGKNITAAFLAAVTLLALAGCGSGDDGDAGRADRSDEVSREALEDALREELDEYPLCTDHWVVGEEAPLDEPGCVNDDGALWNTHPVGGDHACAHYNDYGWWVSFGDDHTLRAHRDRPRRPSPEDEAEACDEFYAE